MQLSEYASNVIENLACRAAQASGGRITPHHVLPYLPVSLGIVEQCLNAMVDGTSITSSVENGLTTYSFTAYHSDAPSVQPPSRLSFETCIACDTDFDPPTHNPICGACETHIREELNTLATEMGWPAQAVYEHEILYHTSQAGKPMQPAELAAVSRFTLRSMRRKLDHLTRNRFARKENLPAKGIATYELPQIPYPREHYRNNMDIILSYPASITEEVQTKFARILITLGCMLLFMFGMAFCGIPFPTLVILFLGAAPVTAISIWRHKRAPKND